MTTGKKKQRVLITGGLGYIGGRLSKFLNKNFDYELLIASRQHNQALLPDKNITLVNLNYDDPINLANQLDGVDTIIHLAAMNGGDSGNNPTQAIKVNVINTVNLLSVAKSVRVKKFIYFSTIHVYGSPLTGHIHEQTLTKATHPYAITHKSAEDYVLATRAQSEIDGIVVRLSNSFGPPATIHANCWYLLVNDLCRNVTNTNQLVLTSDGTQERNFIPLTDVVNAVVHLMHLSKSETLNGLFNLGGNSTLTVLEMTELIAKIYESVSGTTPKIIIPSIKKERRTVEASEKFTYNSNKLKSTGFVSKDDYKQEIEACIYFCKNHFNLS